MMNDDNQSFQYFRGYTHFIQIYQINPLSPPSIDTLIEALRTKPTSTIPIIMQFFFAMLGSQFLAPLL